MFFIYTVFSFLFLALSLSALYLFKSPIYYILLLRIFLLGEFSLLCLFYSTLIDHLAVKKIWFYPILLFIIFCSYNFLTSSATGFDFIPLAVECLFFTVIILFYFYQTMRFNFSIPLFQVPGFWFSVGFLIYFSGTFFLFLFSKSMWQTPGFKIQYTLLYSTITIIKNILLCTAIFVNRSMVDKKKNVESTNYLNRNTFNP